MPQSFMIYDKGGYIIFEGAIMLFSQRKDLKPVKSVVQTDSMDDDLRNGLWNVLTRL